MASEGKVAVAPAAMYELDSSEVLSPHILLVVAKHLTQPTLQKCRLVCKEWRDTFSLVITCVCLRKKQKLQHTLRHVQYTFPRLEKILFPSRTGACSELMASDLRAVLQALANQPLVKRVDIEKYNSSRSAAVLRDLPQHLESLTISAHRWCSSSYQALAMLTALTSLSFTLTTDNNSSDAPTVKQLHTALAGLPKLRTLHLTVTPFLPGAVAVLFLTQLVSECLRATPSLQHFSCACASLHMADALDNVIEAIQQSCPASLQQAACSFHAEEGVQLSGTAIRVSNVHMPVHIQHEHTVVPVAQHGVASAHQPVMRPDCVRVKYTLAPQLSECTVLIDLQQLPELNTLHIDLGEDEYEAAALSGQKLVVTLANAQQVTLLKARDNSDAGYVLSIPGSLAEQCPALRSLTLMGCTADLQHLAMLTRLTFLELRPPSLESTYMDCFQLQPAWLPASLIKLHVTVCDILSCPQHQQPQLTNLVELSVSHCNLDDEQALLAFSGAAHSLQSLYFDEVLVRSEPFSVVLSAVTTFHSIQQLWLDIFHEEQPPIPADKMYACMSAATKLKHLKSLQLPWAVFTADAMHCIISMTQLEVLYLNIEPDDPQRATRYVEQLGNLPLLTDTNVACKHITCKEADRLKRLLMQAWPGSHVVPTVRVIAM